MYRILSVFCLLLVFAACDQDSGVTTPDAPPAEPAEPVVTQNTEVCASSATLSTSAYCSGTFEWAYRDHTSSSPYWTLFLPNSRGNPVTVIFPSPGCYDVAYACCTDFGCGPKTIRTYDVKDC